mmetsp:Transcript_10187/g.42694  ORF Transcript_10187/g.42694 Transcript_10187/m.42694 type:complete len:177 (-) Transcript_10187:2140-2670(-)
MENTADETPEFDEVFTEKGHERASDINESEDVYSRPALAELDRNSNKSRELLIDTRKKSRKRYRKRVKSKSLLPPGGELQERLRALLAPNARETAVASLRLEAEEEKAKTFLAKEILLPPGDYRKDSPSDIEYEDSPPLNLSQILETDDNAWGSRRYSPNSQASDGIEILLRASQE